MNKILIKIITCFVYLTTFNAFGQAPPPGGITFTNHNDKMCIKGEASYEGKTVTTDYVFCDPDSATIKYEALYDNNYDQNKLVAIKISKVSPSEEVICQTQLKVYPDGSGSASVAMCPGFTQDTYPGTNLPRFLLGGK